MAKRVLGLVSLVAVFGLFPGSNAQAQNEGGGLSPSRLKLPSGPGSLEGVGEDASINFNMGVVSYGVPFSVPGGYNGFSPSLRLSYSSTGGQSAVGMGWTLGGVDSIERMTSRGVPDYDTGDLFAHEGSELVRLPGSSTYRARFEGSFVRYTWLGTNGATGNGTEGYWRAEFPDGRVGYYGATAAGVVVPNARMRGSRGTYSYSLVEMVDTYDHAIRYDYELDGGRPYVVHIGWVFRGGTNPRYEVELEYEAREDVLSDGKPGVEVLLNRRLRNVRVLVEGQQLRRYLLSYEPYTMTGGLTRLARVTTFGTGDVDPYPIFFRFAYTQGFDPTCASGTPGCEPAYVRSIGSVGVDFRTGDADLLDINGDALPDVVDTTGGVHRMFVQTVNAIGETSLSPVMTSATAGSGAMALSSSEVEMVDLNGDGFVDMVDGLNNRVLFGRGTGDWDAQALMDTGLPSFSGDANQRFMDVDYDRAIDVVHLDGSGAWFHRNNNGVYQAATSIAGVGRSFTTDGLRLVDMNGDGMVDLVQAVPGAVFYWMNLGHGDFGATREMFGLPGTLTPAEMEFTDLNGDNLTDVVVVQGTEIRFALNCDGTQFDPMQTITSAQVEGSLLERTSAISIRFADMNGSGSTDVVYINASGMVTYVELFPEHPNLLNHIDNGIGKVIEMTYGTTVSHMGRDGGPSAWEHRLPHAMLVLEQLVTYDTLSQVRQIQRMHYRDGYYDGEESQFRGFGEVEVFAEGDDSMEDGRSVMRFDLGIDDRYRHGLTLSAVVESGGRVLSVHHNTFEDCPVAEVPAGTAYPIRSLCSTESRRITQEGRPSAEWVTLQSRAEYDGYGNAILAEDLGVVGMGEDGSGDCEPCDGRPEDVQGAACGETCRGDESFSRTFFVSPGADTGGRWILGAPYRQQTYGVESSDQVAESRTFYDGPEFAGLPLGQLSRGTVRRSEVRRDSGTANYLQVARYRHDSHGNPVVMRDANGHDELIEYDSDGILPLAEVRVFDDPALRSVPYLLRMEVAYEPVLEAVRSATAWMRIVGGANVSERRETGYLHDEYGRLTALISPGDTVAAPTSEYEYDLQSPVSRIRTLTRSTSGSPTPDLESVICQDGRGRTVQTRGRIASGAYLVSGFTQFNLQGAPIRMAQAYQGATGDCDTSPPSDGLAVTSTYDAVGRVLTATQPDSDIYGNASVARTEYLPLRTTEHDAEDNTSDSRHAGTPTTTVFDGLGRHVRLERMLDPTTIVLTTLAYDALGRISQLTDDRGNTIRQSYDLAGRVQAVEHPDSGRTTLRHDDVGNVIEMVDARGEARVRQHDEVNRLVAFWDATDPVGTRTETQYDFAEGCEECQHAEGRAARASYPLLDGARALDTFTHDLRGRLTASFFRRDGVLYEVRDDFDNADRLVSTTYPGGFERRHRYDGVNRIRSVDGVILATQYRRGGELSEIAFANGVTTTREYDVVQRLNRIRTSDPNGEALQDVRYTHDRLGHIIALTDERPLSDGSRTAAGRFQYDALYRLREAVLDPGRSTEETILYTYDTIDNLTEKVSSVGHLSPVHLGAVRYGESQASAGPHAVSGFDTATHPIRYDAAGNTLSREGLDHSWDYLGRLVRVEREPGVPVFRAAYGLTRERAIVDTVDHRTHYLRSDVEVRDGVVTAFIDIEGDVCAKVERALLQPASHGDVAPVGMPDGEVTAADAWAKLAADQGLLGIPPPATERPVEEVLRAAARRLSLPNPAQTVTFWHVDHLGSTSFGTDEAGTVTQRTELYPFGHPREQSAHTPERTFTGQERDLSAGLSYHSARYLDTRLGRWVSPDPMFGLLVDGDLAGAEPQALQPYAYALDPVSMTDRGGEIVPLLAFGAAMLIATAVGLGGVEIAHQVTRASAPPERREQITRDARRAQAFVVQTNTEIVASHAIGAGVGVVASHTARVVAPVVRAGTRRVVQAAQRGSQRVREAVRSSRPPRAATRNPPRRQPSQPADEGAEIPPDIEPAAPPPGSAERAGELRTAIPANSQGRITMGVGVAEDASGARHVLVGTSEPRGYLRPGVTVAPGETIVRGTGHAEADIVTYAQENGLTLLEVGATRPICADCATRIAGAGARATTPLKVKR